MRRLSVAILSVLTSACAPVSTASPPSPTRTTAERHSHEHEPPLPIDSNPASRTAVPEAPTRKRATPLFAGTEFPPPNLSPPHERSRSAGDGEWRPLGSRERGEPLANAPWAVSTVIHPHKVSKWATLTLAAIDLRHVSVHYVPGSEDVKDLTTLGGRAAPEAAYGLVPQPHTSSLLAVFNGGFKPRHGRWGLRVNGQTLLPARDRGCTVALDDQGLVRIGPWPQLAASEQEFVAFRQTPPCLVEEAKLHPLLEQHQERAWGGFDPKRKTRRRSAVGIDQSGRVLYFGIGEEMDPRVLAQGMQHAGAVFAAQLDINWSWTRFLVFGAGKPDAPVVTSTLIPQMVHAANAYIVKPAARDFFYLRARSPASSPP